MIPDASIGSSFSSRPEASARARSSASLSSRSRVPPDCRIVSTSGARSSCLDLRRMISATARTPFRGVRISWLITARKRPLAASASWALSASRPMSLACEAAAAAVTCSSDSAVPTPA